MQLLELPNGALIDPRTVVLVEPLAAERACSDDDLYIPARVLVVFDNKHRMVVECGEGEERALAKKIGEQVNAARAIASDLGVQTKSGE